MELPISLLFHRHKLFFPSLVLDSSPLKMKKIPFCNVVGDHTVVSRHFCHYYYVVKRYDGVVTVKSLTSIFSLWSTSIFSVTTNPDDQPKNRSFLGQYRYDFSIFLGRVDNP